MGLHSGSKVKIKMLSLLVAIFHPSVVNDPHIRAVRDNAMLKKSQSKQASYVFYRASISKDRVG